MDRKFIQLNDKTSDLVILQWNTLADSLAINFPKCSSKELSWDFRESLIRSELTRYDPDIICCEEVDKYDEFYLPQLSQLGYQGIYKRKPGWHRDGTAVFIKRERLSPRSYEIISYENSTQFGLLIYLTYKITLQDFILGATHFKSNVSTNDPLDSFIQLRKHQAEQLMYRIGNTNEPLILSGDFNGEPDEPFYEVLTQYGLKSAYANSNQKAITTYKYRDHLEARLIDYVFLRDVQPTEILEMPSPEEIGAKGLPNSVFPSDHLDLVVKVAFN